MSDADLVLCEGFKSSALPKIEIHRRAVNPRPLWLQESEAAAYYRAVVTDDATFEAPLPVIRLDDGDWLDRLASLVERDVMER